MNKNRKGGKSLKEAGLYIGRNLERAQIAQARAASNAAGPIPSAKRKGRTQAKRDWRNDVKDAA